MFYLGVFKPPALGLTSDLYQCVSLPAAAWGVAQTDWVSNADTYGQFATDTVGPKTGCRRPDWA